MNNFNTFKHSFALADGRVIDVQCGEPLPIGLPDDFEFVLIADHFCETKSKVFVKTRLGTFKSNVRWAATEEVKAMRTITTTYEKRAQEILQYFPEIYMHAKEGKEPASEMWQTCCDDIAELAAYKVATKKPIMVLSKYPTIADDGKHLYGLMFELSMSHCQI